MRRVVAFVVAVAMLASAIAFEACVTRLVTGRLAAAVELSLPQRLLLAAASVERTFWILAVPILLVGALVVGSVLERRHARIRLSAELNTGDWRGHAQKLGAWLVVYLVLWPSMFVLYLLPTGGDSLRRLGLLALTASLIAYIASIVYAYRVQSRLYELRLYRWRGWHIIVGALILNPFFLGFIIPLSTWSMAKRVEKHR